MGRLRALRDVCGALAYLHADKSYHGALSLATIFGTDPFPMVVAYGGVVGAGGDTGGGDAGAQGEGFDLEAAQKADVLAFGRLALLVLSSDGDGGHGLVLGDDFVGGGESGAPGDGAGDGDDGHQGADGNRHDEISLALERVDAAEVRPTPTPFALFLVVIVTVFFHPPLAGPA